MARRCYAWINPKTGALYVVEFGDDLPDFRALRDENFAWTETVLTVSDLAGYERSPDRNIPAILIRDARAALTPAVADIEAADAAIARDRYAKGYADGIGWGWLWKAEPLIESSYKTGFAAGVESCRPIPAPPKSDQLELWTNYSRQIFIDHAHTKPPDPDGMAGSASAINAAIALLRAYRNSRN